MSEHLESKIAESSPAPGMLRSALRWFLAMGVLARLALLASTVGVVGGVAYRIKSSTHTAAGPEPAVGLYWQANVDPTIAPGVAAPLWQLLWRTDAPSIYFKSGTATTAWVKVGSGTSSGGTITGGGTAPDLAVWSGATAIGNYAGSSPSACAANSALSRVTIDAAGALTFTCASVTPGGSISGTAPDLSVFTGAGATVGNYAGSSPAACTAGNVVTGTAISAAGALTNTCTAIGTAGGVTGTGTANDLTKWTGTTATGNANASDDGTTFSINVSSPTFTVTESTGATKAGSLTVNATAASGAGDIEATTETISTTLTDNGAATLNGQTTVGNFAFTEQTSSATGTQNDVALGATTTIFTWTGISNTSFTGFTGGRAHRKLVINNASGHTMTLSNMTGSTAGNQLQNWGNVSLALVGNSSSATYEWDGTGSGQWRMITFMSTQIDATGIAFKASISTVGLSGTTASLTTSVATNGRDSHYRAIVSTPNTGTCGTGATLSATTDAAGTVTIGTTSGGNCSVTFNTTYTNPPACQVRFHDATTNNAISYSTTATSLAITGASDGKTFDYFCVGNI